MTPIRRAVAACVCTLALLIPGVVTATAGMQPQKVSGKVELVNTGKQAFALTALHMQLIYVTGKTRFTGVKSLAAIKRGKTLQVTVLHEGRRYTAVTISAM
jgi:hypothetical protein